MNVDGNSSGALGSHGKLLIGYRALASQGTRTKGIAANYNVKSNEKSAFLN